MRMRRTVTIALVVAVAVVLLASLVAAGCGRRAALRNEGSTGVTTQTPSETTGTESEKVTPSESIDAAKAKALNDQLSSLEKQLNDVDMPSDSVFNDSASALQ